MAEDIIRIIDTCEASENKHLLWFKRLRENHFEGIIAHANYNISAGKIEGINNKIQTLRRQAYGYRDDAYFFSNCLISVETLMIEIHHPTKFVIEPKYILVFVRNRENIFLSLYGFQLAFV